MNIPNTTISIRFGNLGEDASLVSSEPDARTRWSFLKNNLPRIGCKNCKELATKLAASTGASEKQMLTALYSWTRGNLLVSSKVNLLDALAKVFSVSHKTVASLSRARKKRGPSKTKKEPLVYPRALSQKDYCDGLLSFSSDEEIDSASLSTLLQGKERIQAGELVFELLALIQRQRLERALFQNAAT